MDGRATLYANGQTHMFERKVVMKKQRGVLNIKKQNHLFFLFLPKAVFEHVYISTSSRPQNLAYSSKIDKFANENFAESDCQDLYERLIFRHSPKGNHGSEDKDVQPSNLFTVFLDSFC
jgi:hypothetical protein